jgi:hypothetical protein
MTMTTIMERWDSTFAKIDRSCPARRADEAAVDYLRRLSVIGKRYLPRDQKITSVTFKTLPDEVVPKFSEMVREAVERNLTRTDNMEPGTFRTVMRVDEQTGLKTREFYGPRTFCDQFMGRIQRIARINAPITQTVWENSRAKAETRRLW